MSPEVDMFRGRVWRGIFGRQRSRAVFCPSCSTGCARRQKRNHRIPLPLERSSEGCHIVNQVVPRGRKLLDQAHGNGRAVRRPLQILFRDQWKEGVLWLRAGLPSLSLMLGT